MNRFGIADNPSDPQYRGISISPDLKSYRLPCYSMTDRFLSRHFTLFSVSEKYCLLLCHEQRNKTITECSVQSEDGCLAPADSRLPTMRRATVDHCTTFGDRPDPRSLLLHEKMTRSKTKKKKKKKKKEQCCL